MSRRLGLVIAGPTGIGKTEVAASLARIFDGELISCDSVQVYAGLSIGANKTPTDPIPQHMLDLVHWKDVTVFSAADFVEKCHQVIGDVLGRKKTPILVGGTGLYLDWILNGRPTAPATDQLILKVIEEELATDQSDWSKSIERLRLVDSEYASVVKTNDYYRLKRALVVHRMTGQPLSSFKTRRASSKVDQMATVDWKCFYLHPEDRLAMMRHIDRRCEAMIQRGLLTEVLDLLDQGLSRNSQPARAIGYNETISFIDRVRSSPIELHDQCVLDYINTFQAETRKYVRRQENWFASHKEYQWIRRSLTADIDDAVSVITAIAKGDLIDRWIPDRSMTKQMSDALRRYKPVLSIYDEEESRNSLLDCFNQN